MTRRVVKVNDHGLRIGEDHPRAKLTDHDVDRLLEFREADPVYWSYARLGRTFDISKSQARYICNGTQRSQTAKGFVTVRSTQTGTKGK